MPYTIDCNSHLIGCIRESGLNPSASASSMQINSTNFHSAQYGIEYNDLPSNHYVHTKNINTEEWWSVDFQTVVNLKGYEITSESRCVWIYSWRIELSIDGNNWFKAGNEYNEYPKSIYEFNNSYYIKYFKIIGKDNCNSKGFLAFRNIKF